MEEGKKNSVEGNNGDLARFLDAAERYQIAYPKERSKVTFSMLKQIQKYDDKQKKLIAELNLEVTSIRYKHTSVDDKGNMLENKYDVKAGKGEDSSIMRPVFKPENATKMDKEVEAFKEEFYAKPFTIESPYKSEPFYVEVPPNFDFKFLEPFKKFIFNPDLTPEQEEEIFLGQAKDKDQKENQNGQTIKSVVSKQ